MRVNTPLQLLNFVAVVIITSATFTQPAPAQELFNGGELILSTNHFQHYVQARAYTVCVYAKYVGSANRRPQLLQLNPNRMNWDSIEVYGSKLWGDDPGTSSMVGFENRFDTILKQMVGTVWIARSINDVRIVNVGREGDLAPGHEIHDVIAHHYNPNVVIVTTFPQSWHYQTAHITTDGGLTWKKFMPAYLARDYYREYDYGFDARSPQRIHIGINGENPNDPFSLGYRSVYTDDWGARFIDTVINIDGNAQDYRIPNSEKGLGIWSGAGGLSYFDPTFDRGPLVWHLTSDSLFLEPGESPRRVRLSWLENARKSLFPDFDSTQESFSYLEGSNGPVGFHSETPTLVTMTFYHKFPTSSGNDSVSLVALTRDFGETWSLLASMRLENESRKTGAPLDYWVFSDVSIDPVSSYIYISYRHFLEDSLNGSFIGTTHTARWEVAPVGVSNDDPVKTDNTSLAVSPNPVSGSSTIRIRNAPPTPMINGSSLQVYNARGEGVAAIQFEQVSTDEWEVKLPGLAPGVYFIIQTMSNVTHSQKFIVLE